MEIVDESKNLFDYQLLLSPGMQNMSDEIFKKLLY